MKTSSFTKPFRLRLSVAIIIAISLIWANPTKACSAKATFTLQNAANGKVILTNGSTTSSGHFISHWSFSDNTYSLDKSPTHTFSSNGVYQIYLSIIDSADSTCKSAFSLFDTIASQTCSANIVSSTTRLTASFSDSGSTALAQKHSASWNFGDGTNPVKGDYVSHTYNNDGTYSVCVTVYDSSDGCSVTQCENIKVIKCDNIASFSYSIKGRAITFTSNSITSAHTRYKWSFGDGSRDSTTGTVVTHIYSSSLTSVYVNLEIYDSSGGCTTSYSQKITLCKALADYSYQASALSVSFRGDSTMRSSSNITYSWDFGDKSAAANTFDPTHAYANDGTYLVCLTVTDTLAKCSTQDCNNITITHCNLTATFTFTPTSSNSAKLAATTNGSKHIKIWWTLGDGTTDSTSVLTLSHTYNNNPASVSIGLTIYDSISKCYAYANKTCSFCTVKSDFRSSAIGSEITLVADSNNAPSVKYSWSFGDKAKGVGGKVMHTYSNTGNYYICVTAVDSITGCSVSNCENVDVNGNCYLTGSFDDSINGRTVKFLAKTNISKHYNITWYFSDGTVDSLSGPSVTHTFSGSGATVSVNMKVFDSSTTCMANASKSIAFSYCIYGVVTTGNTAGYRAKVYLITYNSTDSSLNAIDSTVTNAIGAYEFCSLKNGNYYTKAVLLDSNPNYKDYIPTYHNDATKWASALEIAVQNATDSNVNIAMKKGTNPGGTGFISGKIIAGAGKAGDPEANILVVLYDASSNPVSYTYTNSLGEYSFANLAFGTYDIFGEILGKLCYPAVVTLSDTAPSVKEVNLSVNLKTITAAIKPAGVWTIENADVYPDPVTNKLTLSMSIRNAGPATLRIYDITGKVVRQLSTSLDGGAQKMEVDASLLPAGLYFLRMEMLKNNTLMEAQFVKIH